MTLFAQIAALERDLVGKRWPAGNNARRANVTNSVNIAELLLRRQAATVSSGGDAGRSDANATR